MIVTTTSEFMDAVTHSGVIQVKGAIGLPLEVRVADGVTIGVATGGGMLYNHDMTAANKAMLIAGKNTRLCDGLILEGPDPEIGTNGSLPITSGIANYGPAGFLVEDIEVRNWPSVGVIACGPDSQVLNNHIHHCRRLGRGYGVAVWGMTANVLIKGNRIEYSRHHICGPERDDTDSYEVCYNIFGISTHSQIDHHGGKDLDDLTKPAGKTLLIHHNKFTYAGQAPVTIRGIPADRCECWANSMPHTGDPYKIWRQELTYGSYTETHAYRNMSQHDNGLKKTASMKVRISSGVH